MNKIKINSLEAIENGYICDYTCTITTKLKGKDDLVITKNYKVFINSPIALGRLFIRLLDSKEEPKRGLKK